LSAATPTLDIRVDQAGYPPDRPKIAIVAASSPAQEFVLRSANDQSIVFRGTLSEVLTDPDSGDTVRAADFTKFSRPGRYYLEVSGVGQSWPFTIAADVFSRAYYLAMRSFYGQRCGTAVDLGAEFPGYKYAACHLEGAYHTSSGKSGSQQSLKGWHDAGDYGRYIVNSGITTGTLLWTWEMYPGRVRGIRLNIPETGNGVPDILNEIRWNLDWMLSMQDTDGGVWHKQTSERFCGFVMPEQDKLVSYVIGSGAEPFKTSCATADFAAVMAIASRAYKSFDAAYSRQTLQAAQRAWKWVSDHPSVLFRNPAQVRTGEYGDRDCADEMLWAAAELWRSTGEPSYRTWFLGHYPDHMKTLRATAPPAWPNVAPLALWTYVMGGARDEAAGAIRKAALAAADEIVARSSAHAWRMSMTRGDFVWGSNGVAANYGVQLLVADRLQPDRRYVNTALENLHYLLGRNPFSVSWVTQVGANPFRHPHHRPSGADANPEPWPGLLSGGPNGRRQDPAMQKLPDNLPPARMYVDDQASYASNENAINWNAPLVLLLAGALPESGPPVVSRERSVGKRGAQ
jgi:endoglucanase